MSSLAVRPDADGVVRIEMTRSVLDAAMIRELADAFERLGEDPRVRALVLAGQGEAFSTGADLPRVVRANQPRAEWSVADTRAFARMLWLIESCSKSTIACVHGLVAGSGIGLVCACEFGVASDDASFALAEPHSGDVPAVIRPYLVNAMGRQQAQCLAMGRSRIGALEARRIGLVQAVVPTRELHAATQALGAFLGGAPMRQLNRA